MKMKRVDCFEVRVVPAESLPENPEMQQCLQLRGCEGKSRFAKARRLPNWHQARRHVHRLFQRNPYLDASEVVIVDVATASVLVRFSKVNLESQRNGYSIGKRNSSAIARQTAKSWDSLAFMKSGESRFFENRNLVDFQWHWVDGMSGEQPFRRSRLERAADQNSICAFALQVGSSIAYSLSALTRLLPALVRSSNY
ncbi:MAG: hypothetical protein VXZ82_07175 [Planctomycetota bacterium]|nr:hypothetical protein [Planctomycetota bacterium]